ncbi:MAG: hypothetical protein IKN80_08970 [Clostridiales bacterium]|nr:hypothetical protein [Clostridiales bacterium]
MIGAIKEYDAKIDSKKRITLRSVAFDYYHVIEREDGTIMLEPRILTSPYSVSENTLNMMDKSVENIKRGKVSEPIDLSDIED